MLGVQCIPDVANCAVVLDDSTEVLNHEGHQSSRMNVLSGLYAQS